MSARKNFRLIVMHNCPRYWPLRQASFFTATLHWYDVDVSSHAKTGLYGAGGGVGGASVQTAPSPQVFDVISHCVHVPIAALQVNVSVQRYRAVFVHVVPSLSSMRVPEQKPAGCGGGGGGGGG